MKTRYSTAAGFGHGGTTVAEEYPEARALLRDYEQAERAMSDARAAAANARDNLALLEAERTRLVQARDVVLDHTLAPRALADGAAALLGEYTHHHLGLLALDDLLERLALMVEALDVQAREAADAFDEAERIYNAPENENLRWQIERYRLTPAEPARVAAAPRTRSDVLSLNTGRPKETDAELARRKHSEAIAPAIRQRAALQNQLPMLRQQAARTNGAPWARTQLANAEEEIAALTRTIDAHTAAAPK